MDITSALITLPSTSISIIVPGRGVGSGKTTKSVRTEPSFLFSRKLYDIPIFIRVAEHWCSLRITEFQQRQFRAIRDEPDRAHTERTASVVRADFIASHSCLSTKDLT